MIKHADCEGRFPTSYWYNGLVGTYFDELSAILKNEQVACFASNFTEAILRAYGGGKTIYLCGNGGNAGTLAHMACDLTLHPFVKEDKSGFPLKTNGFRVVNMCESPSVVTGLSNDAGPHNVFAAQLSNAKKGDLIICLSGSGNSPNITAAAIRARKLRMSIFGIARNKECALKKLVGSFLCVGEKPSKFPGQTGANDNNFYFEDCVLMLGHLASGALKEFVSKESKANR
jgi:D-sedoheptulose 7-phosphate isomerase